MKTLRSIRRSPCVPLTDRRFGRSAALSLAVCMLLAAATRAAEAPDVGQPKPPAISGPREMLATYGIDESHFRHLLDGEPIGGNEQEVLVSVLFRLPYVGQQLIEQWSHGLPAIAEMAAEADKYRGDFFSLAGRLTHIETQRPLDEAIERFEFDRYYRCELLLDNGQPAIVYTRTVPKAWREGGDIDARVGALGLLLKLGSDDPGRPTPIFASLRLAWYPDTPLGDLGMDVGLLDESRDRTGITGEERECFYQMLAAAGRAEPGQLLCEANQRKQAAPPSLNRSDADEFSVVPLFNEAAQQRGRLVVLSGTARRVERIRVGDSDVVARFGIDHYYQIFLFTEDSDANPLVFCVRQLPPEMPTGSGDDYAERVRVAGFFLKTWAYRLPRPLETETDQGPRMMQGQLAPLLIGLQPVWYPPEKPMANTSAAMIAGGLFIAALLGVWVAVWSFGRGDRRFRRSRTARAADADVSLDDLGLDTDARCDFSQLRRERQAE